MFFYNEPDNEGGQIQTIAEDPYFYNTSLLLNMDNDFSDSSIYGNEIVPYGNVSHNTTESKYGGGSAYFNGNGNILAIMQGGEHFNFGTDNFTIEFWHKPTSNNTRQWFFHADADYWIGIDKDVTGRYGMWASSTGTSWDIVESNSEQGKTTNSALLNQWNHIAFVRSGNSFMIFLNGNLEKTVGGNGAIFDRSNEVKRIGEHSTPSFLPIEGYIDDFRVTKGVARYTANFTPPAEPHPTTGPSEIVSDQLTFHLDSSNVNSYPGTGTTWTSLVNSSDIGTFVGDPTFNAAEADSIDLDGNGDYVQIDNTSLFDFSGDFTIEMTMKLDQIGQTNGATIVLSNDVLDGFQLHSTGNSMNVSIGGSTVSSPAYSSSVVGRWSTFTMSRISGVIYFYDNANLMGTVNNSTNIDSSALYLGVQTPSRVPFYAHFTDGKIGSFRVYSKGLSSEEVLQNFNATKDRFGL